eukprot:Hpha_TRINITY_DN16160_c1_g6::TRINITY_DN16160_c1_g6_i1::g.3231::m.3231
MQAPSQPYLVFAHFCEHSGAQLLSVTKELEWSQVDESQRPVLAGQGYATAHEEAGVCWVTRSRNETIIQSNITRAFSGEHVGPGRQGALVFGSGKSFCFTELFLVKDAQAR